MRRRRSNPTWSFCLLVLLLTAPIAGAADWLQHGGPTADFKVADEGLAKSWPADGPRELWSRELGGGYSGIAVQGDHIYTMFRRGEDEVITALDRATGDIKKRQIGHLT